MSIKLLGECQYQIDKDVCLSWTVERCPAEENCPLRMNIEGYITAIAQGRFKEALDIVKEVTPFPASLARICPRPCEGKCKRNKVEEAIAIRSLKRFVADYDLWNTEEKPIPYPRTKEEKVAIVGSGPAGLTAAFDLVKEGYRVTVFERSSTAGGMMAKAIPDFNLPKEVVAIEVDRIINSGVEIKVNIEIGKDFTLDDIFHQGYKAIFIATGMPQSLDLKIPGADLSGVYTALPLLEAAKLSKRMKLEGKVTIIGGGNVAIDIARTVLRWGAKEVDITCLESRAEMPAFEWEIDRAEAEGIKIHSSLAPQRFLSKNGRRVSAIDFNRVDKIWFDEEHRIRWSLEEGFGTELTMATDNVIVAIGQKTDLSYLENSGLHISKRGTIIVNPDTLSTNREGIFSGGDVIKGFGTVVEAMAEGHKAAASIVRYLQGERINKDHGREDTKLTSTGEDRMPKGIIPREVQVMPMIPVGRAIRSFEEVEIGFTEKEAITEAERCLECKTCNRCIKDYRCIAMKWEPNEPLARRSPQIDLDICVGCVICSQICPYESITAKESVK